MSEIPRRLRWLGMTVMGKRDAWTSLATAGSRFSWERINPYNKKGIALAIPLGKLT
jgi:hypothetical protein